MEEAEVLCDRLGIFVDGQLICVGPPRAITARYGGYLVSATSIHAYVDHVSLPQRDTDGAY